MEAICYTLEGALEKAIEEEKKSVKVYREAMKKVEDPHARALRWVSCFPNFNSRRWLI